MKFDLGDRTYTFDDERVSFAEFRYVKRELGLSSGDFLTGLPRYDVEALGAAVLLTMHRQAVMDPSAPVFTLADLDKLDMLALINSVAEHALLAGQKATQQEADAELNTAAADVHSEVDGEVDGEPEE